MLFANRAVSRATQVVEHFIYSVLKYYIFYCCFRDQITLNKLLGRGAFGEVYEGEARLVPNKKIKVAVKTLRASASEQEKNDFLQEAQLMSQFQHEHILQFLGVCLDNDPQYIIMELMQGGDLLTYLRLSRNPTVRNVLLF